MSEEVTLEQAYRIVKKNLIDGSIQAVIRWEDNWLFSVYTSDFDEGDLDPFYAVNLKTGAFSGFSIVGDQDTSGILDAFSESIEHSYLDDFLMHYGVKGMKWGVRKDRSSGGGEGSTKSSKAAKTSAGLEAASNAIKPIVGPFIPRASISSTIMKVGQAALTGLPMQAAMKTVANSPAAIAGYAVTGLDSGGYRIPGVATKNLIRGGWNKDTSLADPKMSVGDIQTKVVKQINPQFPGLGTTNNCLRCTYAYEMRRRGNDVASTKTVLASGQTPIGPKVMTKSLKTKTKIKNPTKPTTIVGKVLKKPPTAADVLNTLAKEPDRSRGDLQMRWGAFMGGHSVAYEIVNGKAVVFDTQSGKTYSTPQQLSGLTRRASSLSFNRLDNKDINSIAVTAWVKDR